MMLALTPAATKEPDEYSTEFGAEPSSRLPGKRARSHVRHSAHVLVCTARIVGEPFHLYRAPGRRSGLSAGLPHQPGLAAVPPAPSGGATADRTRHALRPRRD